MAKIRIIDPPRGWQYGFPKPVTLRYENQDINEWLVEQGYPKELIERYGDYFYCRNWMDDSEHYEPK